jgi:cyclic pyranopterin monophosphate synthase
MAAPGRKDTLSHVDERGRASMVDVGGKAPVRREAVAEGYFCAAAGTLDLLEGGKTPKGEALAVARIAGIQAAKRCDELIPLCHSLPLEHVSVEFERTAPDRLRIVARASTTAKTGVEMEALTAVAAAALTLWDMTKAVDTALRIDGVRVVEKIKNGL